MKANYKSRVPKFVFTPAEDKAMKAEISRQIVEMNDKYAIDIDAMILYTLHERFGFGKKRLREFYFAMKEERDKLEAHYEMPGEFNWLVREQLKKLGIDIQEWYDEIMAS